MVPAPQTDILLIGYGNDLRGDDAVGPIIAASIEEMHLPGVRVITCHQLTPELADDIARAKTVFFVDASVEIQGDTAQVIRIEPAAASGFNPHIGDPRSLLCMAQTLYGQCPVTWCVHVPVKEFELGAKLSPTAERGVKSALEQIKSLIAQ